MFKSIYVYIYIYIYIYIFIDFYVYIYINKSIQIEIVYTRHSKETLKLPSVPHAPRSAQICPRWSDLSHGPQGQAEESRGLRALRQLP